MEQTPRLTSITGVSRALITTLGVDDAVGVLVRQFGWDLAFSALARIDGAAGASGMWRAVEGLVCDADAAQG
ncbi:MAG: hypothetical protein WD250_10405 [Egibacteraceae bacterium]